MAAVLKMTVSLVTLSFFIKNVYSDFLPLHTIPDSTVSATLSSYRHSLDTTRSHVTSPKNALEWLFENITGDTFF